MQVRYDSFEFAKWEKKAKSKFYAFVEYFWSVYGTEKTVLENKIIKMVIDNILDGGSEVCYRSVVQLVLKLLYYLQDGEKNVNKPSFN